MVGILASNRSVRVNCSAKHFVVLVEMGKHLCAGFVLELKKLELVKVKESMGCYIWL